MQLKTLLNKNYISNMREIPKIKIDDYDDFTNNSKVFIYTETIDTIEYMIDEKLDQATIFVIESDTLKKPKEFVIVREKINDYLENALPILEEAENYEYCDKIIKMKNERDI